MSMDATLAEDAPLAEETVAPSDIRGLIDNATADRLYGWVWDAAHPGYRVKVELRLEGKVVATGVASNPRPDLAKHGIGDGSHAFEFPLQRQWFRQLRDLSVIAYGRDGTTMQVPVHARRQEEALVPATATAQLQIVAETLVAEQASMRGEMEAMRRRMAGLPDGGALDAVAQAGQEMQRRLDTMELWITRLDDRLAQLVAPPEAGAKGGVDVWQVVLIGLLAGLGCGVMAFILARYGI
ncbi:hypothetical protein JMJ56_10995 [Belnapia sp. T18]|uniref:Uncharacterized protein n=1 Tax=Belnapia arida TaxID=2804533 RepID=A0ABS1U1J4_9PROT|nr:hypothetical protein [Belnapia arida]MBL6078533.1 hypothetical protein [Belnapia arida]